MGRMKSSWDEETQNHFLEQLMEIQFDEGEAMICDRRPFEELDRQPDLIVQNKSGEASGYVYLLQPSEIKEDFFDIVAGEEFDRLDLYVPHSSLEDVKSQLESPRDGLDVIPFRINCGQLQILDG